MKATPEQEAQLAERYSQYAPTKAGRVYRGPAPMCPVVSGGATVWVQSYAKLRALGYIIPEDEK